MPENEGNKNVRNLNQPFGDAMRARWAGFLGTALLIFGTLAIYCRTLSSPLLYDDLWSIAGNPSIHRLWPIGPVLNPPRELGVGGRPLLNLSFALNYALGGTGVRGYHVVNILIHLASALILFALVKQTLRHGPLAPLFSRVSAELALAVSALWAWHPVQTISVTYISERSESLAGLFYLLTLYCFASGARGVGKLPRWAWYSLSVTACVAGVATKEVVVTAPLAVLLYDRAFVSGGFRNAWRLHWRWYAALAIATLSLFHRLSLLQEGGVMAGVGFGGGIAWWDYALSECRVIIDYLGLVFWPHPLVFDHGPALPCRVTEVWPYAVMLASLLAATVIALKRAPMLGFAAAFFFLMLAPTSSVIPVVGQAMAENRLYLPIAGIIAIVVVGGFALIGRASLPIFAVVAVCLGSASYVRNRDYASELGIWSDTVSKDAGNPRAHGNLARILAKIPGRQVEAIAEYRDAARLDPSAEEVRVNLGNLLLRSPGHLEEAISQYQEAVRLRAGDAEAHLALAYGLSRVPGRRDDAVAQYEAALVAKPDFAAAHVNLGNLLLGIPGRTYDAIGHLEQAVVLKPDWPEAQFALAAALIDVPDRRDQARKHLEEVIRLQPGNVEARAMLQGLSSAHP
jgi:Flp pilus assembly protein TadD